MAAHVGILASVERLWPHEQAGASFVFAMNVQAAMVEAFAHPGDFPKVEPWTWDPIDRLVFWAVLGAVSAPLLNAGQFPEVLTPDPADLPPAAGKLAAITALTKRRNELWSNGGAAAFLFDPARPDALPPDCGFHRSLVTATGTLCGSLASSLNLGVTVRITRAKVDPQFLDANGEFKTGLLIIAAPRFTRGGTTFNPASTGPVQLGGPLYKWEYAPAGAFAYTAQVDLDHGDVAHRFFHLQTYWVRKDVGVALPDPGEDWHTKLADRVGDAWNLPRHLLDAVGGLVALPQNDFAALWEALLAAIRDRAGLGLIDPPDGRDLLEFATGSAVPRPAAVDDLAVRDGQIAALTEKLRLWDRLTTRAEWRDAVAAVLPSLGAGLSATPPVQPLRIRVVWPPAESAALGASRPVTLQRADIQAGPWTDVPGLQNITLGLGATPDGGRAAEVSVSGTTAPVRPGWFRGVVDLGAGGVKQSAAVSVGPAVADALGPLARVAGALQAEPPLIALVQREWDRLATRTDLRIAAGNALSPLFTTVRFVSNDFTTPDSPEWVESGTLDLDDGNTRVVTLGGIGFFDPAPGSPSKWVPGAGYEVDFVTGPTDTPTETLRVRVTLKGNATAPLNKQLRIELIRVGHTPSQEDVTVPAAPDSAFDAAPAHHLRVIFEKNAGNTKAKVLFGWFADGPVPANGFKDACTHDLPAPMNGAAIVVRHRLLVADPLLMACVPPTCLTVRPADFTTAIAKWDATPLDKAVGLWGASGSGIVQTVPGLQPRRRLVLAQSARLWAVWNYQQSGTGDFRTFFEAELKNYLGRLCLQRFGWGGSVARKPYFDFSPGASVPSAPVRQLVTDQLTNFAVHLIDSKQLIPAGAVQAVGNIPAETDGDTLPTKTPHGLNLQVDRWGAFGGTVGDDADLLRHVAGVGIILRQAKTGAGATPFANQPWRVLNLAAVAALSAPDEHAPDDSTYDAVFGRAVAPVRVLYKDDAREAVVTYDDQPLTARSPLTEVAKLRGFREVEPAPETLFAPFRYETADTADPWAKLPSLKFGQFYEILPFLIGNAGALPRALSNGHPAVLNRTGLTTIPADAATFVRRLRYLRRVSVGSPRLASPRDFLNDPGAPSYFRDQPDSTGLPAIPDGVLPLARELGLQAVTAARPQARFFFDPNKRTGQLPPSSRWAVNLPRVAVSGQAYKPDTDSAVPAVWAIRFGLLDDPTADAVKVSRNGPALTAVVGSTSVSVALKANAQNLHRGSIDLRLERDGGVLTLHWRRSDRGDGWTKVSDWTQAAPTLTRACVFVEVTGAAPLPVVTFGTPSHGVSLVDELNPPTDDHPLTVLRLPPASDPTDRRGNVMFGIRPPGTDLQTWSRWYSMDLVAGTGGATEAKRKEIWTRFHERLPVVGKDENSPPGLDLTFDDPAVSHLLFELIPLLVEPTSGVVQRVTEFVPVPTAQLSDETGPTGRKGLPHVQAKPYKVMIQAVGTPPANRLVVDTTERTVTVSVCEGEIWDFRVHPAVANSWFDNTQTEPGGQRFHSRFGDTTTSPDAAGVRLCPPWRLTAEVATRTVVLLGADESEFFPGGADQALDRERVAAALAWHAVAPAFDGRSVTVRLNKLVTPTLTKDLGGTGTVPATPRRFRYATGIRLSRQVWRWRGRQVPPLPFESAVPDPDALPTSLDRGDPLLDAPETLAVWDAAGFGDRSGIDLLDEARTIGYATPVAGLFQEDLTTDRRALYYRFCLQLTSRYSALFPEDPPTLVAAGPDPLASRDQPRLTPWRRLVVPCRLTGDLQRPVVRFVVPLTQPHSDPGSAKAPGLLVVLDEPGFATGGLAEAIEAEVVRVSDPFGSTPGNEVSVSRPEFGPDPTIRGEGWTSAATGGTGEDPPAKALPMDVDGLIGHTFDTDADAPLFNAASFFLSPPDVTPISDDESLAWYFAKIRFRRLLRPEGLAELPPPVPVSLSVPQTFSLAPITDDRDWVVSLTGLAIPTGNPTATVEYVLSKSGTTLATLRVRGVAGAPNTVELSFDTPAGTTSVTCDLATEALGLDLRLVFQLDESTLPPPPPPPPPPPRHVTVSYRVRRPKAAARFNRWRTLQAAKWEALWPTDVRVTPSVAVTLDTPRVTVARVSKFTPPYWVQFLPDSARLRPDPEKQYRLRWKPVNRAELNREPQFELLAADGTVIDPSAWGLGVQKAWPPSTEFPELHFNRRLLLTAVVRDIRGQSGQERYLGLYEPRALALACVHRSPALAPQEWEQDLKAVRVRVVEFQVAGPAASSTPWNQQQAAWSTLFGPPDPPEPERASDVAMRIVRVSPPLDLPAGT